MAMGTVLMWPLPPPNGDVGTEKPVLSIDCPVGPAGTLVLDVG